MEHQKHKELLGILHECMETCNYCYHACLQETDILMMSECIRLDRECADFCAYVEQAISRNTIFLVELIAVCAVICEACGKECKKHLHDHCQQCAEVCFTCADVCRNVA